MIQNEKSPKLNLINLIDKSPRKKVGYQVSAMKKTTTPPSSQGSFFILAAGARFSAPVFLSIVNLHNFCDILCIFFNTIIFPKMLDFYKAIAYNN